jgi:hypothetical protein
MANAGDNSAAAPVAASIVGVSVLGGSFWYLWLRWRLGR